MGCTLSLISTCLFPLSPLSCCIEKKDSSDVTSPAPVQAPAPDTSAEDVRIQVADEPSALAKEEDVAKHFAAPTDAHLDSFGNLVDQHGGRVWPEAYYAARKEAEEEAILRGKCFEESKKAFEEDRKGDAKELSDRGKEHGAKMEAANKRAMEIIIGPQNLAEAEKIDLHGLLVQEAVEATRDFVKSSIGRLETVQVITGQCLHSDKAKGPVIKPAILELCKEEGWKIDPQPNNPGCFIVQVPASN